MELRSTKVLAINKNGAKPNIMLKGVPVETSNEYTYIRMEVGNHFIYFISKKHTEQNVNQNWGLIKKGNVFTFNDINTNLRGEILKIYV